MAAHHPPDAECEPLIEQAESIVDALLSEDEPEAHGRPKFRPPGGELRLRDRQHAPLRFVPQPRNSIMDEPTKPVVETIPSVAGGISAIASAGAPFIYFESAPFYALRNGVGKITLTASRHIAQGTGTAVLADHVIVGHLVGSLPTLRALRAAIDGVLLIAEPAPQGEPH
jgi:hypothetical protein